MSQQSRFRLLVFVQFACLLLLALTGPVFPCHPLSAVVVLAGVALGVWAVQSMGAGNLNISPAVRPNATLVQRGPYRLIRHPMYAALLLVSVGWTFNQPSLLRWVTVGLLLGNLVVKMHVEERLLSAHDSAYREYMQRSHRLIPFLY